jgi:hypothetical protein
MKENSPKKLGRPPKKQPIDEAPPKRQPIDDSGAVGIMPLDYMLAVVRDPTAAQCRRDRMAIAAAPYCHLRTTEAPLGKKEQALVDARAPDPGTSLGELIAQRQHESLN